jgi:hypothetical protein
MEVRGASTEWNRLAAETLTRSGQEFALYLRTRNLGTTSEDLSGLPVENRVPGYSYALRFPEGVVELRLDGEAGKISTSTADVDLLQNFATLWTGNAASGVQLVAAIKDWSDTDSEEEPNGAEAGFYYSLGYAPRNGTVGLADLPLVRGFGFEDFYPRVNEGPNGPVLREPLDAFLTPAPTGSQINPNFAPRLVLLSVPGLSIAQVDQMIEARSRGAFFRNAEELQAIIALPPDSGAWRFFRFDPGMAPAITTIVENTVLQLRHVERRVYEAAAKFNPVNGRTDFSLRLHRIDR